MSQQQIPEPSNDGSKVGSFAYVVDKVVEELKPLERNGGKRMVLLALVDAGTKFGIHFDEPKGR